MILIENENYRNLVKKISSYLMRAKMEENRNINLRNKYLEIAGIFSIKLGNFLLIEGEKIESSRYLLSAGDSFMESQAFQQSKSCFNKVIEIGISQFIDEAKEKLSLLPTKNYTDFNFEEKEDRLHALDDLIWTINGLDTLGAMHKMQELIGIELTKTTIRNYARELEERGRIVIWGGPQGRIYHMYPNIVDLPLRHDTYGTTTIIGGSLEERMTNNFTIDFQTWNYNREIFIINGSITPKMLITIDMDGFLEHIDKLNRPHYPLKAVGTIESSSQLKKMGYQYNMNKFNDVFTSTILIDNDTGGTLYQRNA